jgi:hypothetical protein
MKKRAGSHKDRFSKTLFALSLRRTAKDDGFRDLLSRSQMHVDEWDEVALATQQRCMQKIRCVGGSWLFVVDNSVTATRIYREELTRVTASHK